MCASERLLVEKVELRLALADSQEKIQRVIDLYLAPILLKFSSKDQTVRIEVIKCIKIVLARFNSYTELSLPVEILLEQAKRPQAFEGAEVTNIQLYSLLFVSKGISRLSKDQKREFLPNVIEGISDYNLPVNARLFGILCKLVMAFDEKESKVDNGVALRELLQLDGKNKGYELYLIEKFAKFMLLQPVRMDASHLIPKESFPGLSEKDSSFFTHDAGLTFDYKTLTQYKKKILLFTEHGFTKRSALIDICASSDPNSFISDVASSILRKKGVDFNDDFIISFLERMFMGDEKACNPPAGLKLQTKIIEIFCKSESIIKSDHLNEIIEIGLNSTFPKLKNQTIIFIRWITTRLAGNVNFLSSEELTRKIRDNLLSEKVSEMNSDMNNYILQRRYQYEALGLILQKCPKSLDIDMLKFMFDMLRTENSELRPSVMEILNALVLRVSEFTEKEQLKRLLVTIIESDDFGSTVKPEEWERSARYIAVKYVNQAFPFQDAEARMLDIMVQTKNDKPETIEESLKGLQPYLFEMQQITQAKNNTKFPGTVIEFPRFSSLVSLLSQEISNIDTEKALRFCFQSLIMNSIKKSKTLISCDSNWEIRIDSAIELDPKTRDALRKHIGELFCEDIKEDDDGDICMDEMKTFNHSMNAIEYFLSTAFEHFVKHQNEEMGRILATFVSFSPTSLINKFSNEIPLLVDILPGTFSRTVSTYTSQTLGILCSNPHLSKNLLDSVLNSLLEREEIQPLCYIISRAMTTRRACIISVSKFAVLLDIIHQNLKSNSSEKKWFAMDSLSQLALFGCLGPKCELGNLADQKEKFVYELMPLLKSTHDDLAAMSWSYLSLTYVSSDIGKQDENNPFDNHIFETALFEAHSTKHTDFLFSVGEAFTVLAMGWNSGKMSSKFDITAPIIEISQLMPDFDHTDQILQIIFEACESTKPALRRAGCIWLLSMVQYCKGSQKIVSQLSRIQNVFMKYLTDRQDIIQESASRGLSIVYNLGDAQLRDKLIHNMLVSFSDSTKSSFLASGTIEEGTEIFEPGVLTTDDGSVSTYKDILNLASEVGDPSLVYKFMSLAKNSSLWSSRKGIAYGLEAIFDKDKLDDLLQKDEHLMQKLIPSLYRYQFDPSLSVSRVMSGIWDSLILDPNSLLIKNFTLIFNSLIKGMGDREWRIRQSSTAALDDLLQRSPESLFSDKITSIWHMAFRILDDIKESVRKQGVSLTRNLMDAMIHTIEKNESGSQDALEQLLPFLLGTNGILNSADDVRNFSLGALMKIIKTSSKSLKPFAAGTIKQLILLMSSIEPQAVNYLSLNADKYKLSIEDIDTQRLNLLNSSPVMEAIETLLDLLDDTLMPDFLDQLSDAVKSSVNLPSKVTASKIVVDLIVKHFFLAKDNGDRLLKICMRQLKNHNSTISGSYSAATGYCTRVASSKKVSKLSKKLLRYYFEAPSDDNYLQVVSARTCLAIVNHSKDRFESFASSFVPLIFVGKHDTDKKVSILFRNAWNESNGSSVTTIKLYLPEIVKLIKSNIDSNNMSLRRTIGATVISIIQNLGESVGKFPKYLSDLYSILLNTLQGRSYEGKESLLNSLVLLSINSAAFLDSHPSLHEKVSECILREAEKQNLRYRRYSVKALGKFIGSFTEDQKLYDAYIKCMRSFLEESYLKEFDTDDFNGPQSEDKNSRMRTQMKQNDFRRSILENLILAVNDKDPNIDIVQFIFKDVFKKFVSGNLSDFKTKLVLMESSRKLATKLNHACLINDSTEGHELVDSFLQYWRIYRKEFSTEGSIQRVVIEFIRLTSLLAKTFLKICAPSDLVEMEDSLQQIARESTNSVVAQEAKKSLASLTEQKV